MLKIAVSMYMYTSWCSVNFKCNWVLMFGWGWGWQLGFGCDGGIGMGYQSVRFTDWKWKPSGNQQLKTFRAPQSKVQCYMAIWDIPYVAKLWLMFKCLKLPLPLTGWFKYGLALGWKQGNHLFVYFKTSHFLNLFM